MNILLIIAGSALIATALRDQFYTLFHPAGRAVMGDYVARAFGKSPIGYRRGSRRY